MCTFMNSNIEGGLLHIIQRLAFCLYAKNIKE